MPRIDDRWLCFALGPLVTVVVPPVQHGLFAAEG